MRDGTPNETDKTATNRPDENTKDDSNVGQHETYEYYKKCQTRDRNRGLYIADQNIGNKAVNTRQNNGARYGWECPEERDYYPYWHPTEWRDIAVFTTDMTKCDIYRTESQNVKDKGECWKVGADGSKTYLQYNNFLECSDKGGQWIESGKWGLKAPQCLSASLIASKDNYLGDGLAGKPAQYNWVLPFNVASDACVLRVRYNITTADLKWEMDASLNADKSPLKQDPLDSFGYDAPLSMAVNTNQFGRTFQDRSYVFSIKSRKGTKLHPTAKIYNINVIGKRGNIVDVHPAHEYRFVPEHLSITAEDYVHFQWVGSDYNPNREPNNAEGGPRSGDGALRSDRSNVVQLDYPGESIPRPAQYNTMFLNGNGKPDMALINKLAFAGQPFDDPTKCWTKEQILAEKQAGNKEYEFDPKNCAKLNGVNHPYFDATPVKLRSTGTFYYMSTRNNNFSNRGQKASITVVGGQFASATRMSGSAVVALLCLLVTAFFMF